MEEVKSIGSAKIDSETVAALEELLDQAKSGNLSAVLFVDKYHNGDVGHAWHGHLDRRMIGEIENLKFNFFSQMYFPVVED